MKNLKTVKVPGINIRLAKNTDPEINGIARLEEEVWKENGANEKKIRARLEVFPAGSYIAEDEKSGKIVGYVCFQQVGDLRKQESLNWFKITDDGYTIKSHQPDGEYLYGISLSVHYSMNGKNLAQALIAQAFVYMLAFDKKGFFVGSRIPMFRRYKARYPGTTVENYVKMRRKNGDLYDYELYLYHNIGLAPIIAKILPDFFPDPDSENYGALLFDENILLGRSNKEIETVMQMIINQDFSSLKNVKR